MTTRVFLVGDWTALGEHLGVRAFLDPDDGPRQVTWPGFAVTDALREALPGLDDEGLEHYAMTEAAQASLGNFYDEGEPMRRLVIVVDVARVEPRSALGSWGRAAFDPEHPGLVGATVELPEDVVAWMVDSEEARHDVLLASAAYRVDDDDAPRLAQACLDHELGWYAATEVDEVLGLS